MQAIRKCARCNTENAPNQIYCTKCGKFLPAKGTNTSNSVTIWDMSDHMVKGRPRQSSLVQKKEEADITQRYVVICPQCKSTSEAANGIIPLACGECGYFFQAGIDRAIPETLLGQQVSVLIFTKNKANKKTASQTNAEDNKQLQGTTGRKNPLAGVGRDMSGMRLILISQREAVPEEVNEDGDVIGVNGTILKMIKTKQQISLWHSPAGWYARTLAGQPLYNGVPVNVGRQIKLNDGDMLTIENEQIRVEII